MKHSPGATPTSVPLSSVLESVDLSLAHLLVVPEPDPAGELVQVWMRCFWTQAVAERVQEGRKVASRGAVAPCAVVSECSECAGFIPTDERFEMHGQSHVRAGARAMLLHEELCGLTLTDESLTDPVTGRPKWVEQLVAELGPGIYLVFPAVDAGGNLVGVNPLRVDETA